MIARNYEEFDHNRLEPLEPSFSISIGELSFEIRWYAICIIIGVLIALFFALRWLKFVNIKEDYLYWGLALGLICGLLGARLFYCLFNLKYFIDEPITIITKISEGGLAIHGGLIGSGLFMIVFCKVKKINFFKIAEIVFPGFLIAQACGRWGNFFNQEAHGGLVPGYPDLDKQRAWLQSFLPDFIVNQMYIDSYQEKIQEYAAYYQPTFLYESIWNIIGFIFIIILRKKYQKYQIGDAFFIYLVWYGIGRFIIEIMRTDPLTIGGLKVAQICSIIMIIFGIVFYLLRHRHHDLELWKK